MMRLLSFLIPFVLSFSAHSEYTWYDYDPILKKITFGTRYSDFTNDKVSFNWFSYPIFVTIDKECDIAYLTDSKTSGIGSKICILGLSSQITRNPNNFSGLKVQLHPFSVEANGVHYPRTRSYSSINIALQCGESWKLYTGLFCFDHTVDLMDMLFVVPDSDLIVKHTNENLELETMKNFFSAESKFSRSYYFKTAISAMNPYAYALMYLAFKHGLWGTNESSILAEIYKEGADKKTIEDAEKNLDTIRLGLKASPLDKGY